MDKTQGKNHMRIQVSLHAIVGELPSAMSETITGFFPKPAPSTLSLFPKVSYAEYDMKQILEECELLQRIPGSKEKQPVTQMTFDLHTTTARVAELKRENTQR
ncbi:hypothetical protein HAX54_003843 [Datura stramonium]|uniref:Uncharacterized protein n=1 Tax=Datura stramonium TaxID=4076 RepID=A0ABS8T606_DATST|nr:hypothetical protein [Datura stramonium]